MSSVSEQGFQFMLQEVLSTVDVGDELGYAHGVESAPTFEECGVLTHNKGLVVRLEDGSEFQVTVVKSR